MAKKRIGVMTCPEKGCDGVVVAREDDVTKTLSYRCDAIGCDSSGYCKASEARYSRWRAAIKPDVPAKPAPKAEEKPAPVKVPEKTAAGSRSALG